MDCLYNETDEMNKKNYMFTEGEYIKKVKREQNRKTNLENFLGIFYMGA